MSLMTHHGSAFEPSPLQGRARAWVPGSVAAWVLMVAPPGSVTVLEWAGLLSVPPPPLPPHRPPPPPQPPTCGVGSVVWPWESWHATHLRKQHEIKYYFILISFTFILVLTVHHNHAVYKNIGHRKAGTQHI